jgi:hypothetical protein
VGLKFLQELGLTAEEEEKLGRLGLSSPAAVLAMRRAAPEPFDNLLGKDRADEIVARIKSQMTPVELDQLNSRATVRRFPLGAILGAPPSELLEPKFDIEERDRLFGELRSLRQLSSPTQDQLDRMAELEARLNSLLESK